MATGLEIYSALRNATRQLTVGGCYTINHVDAHDLCKLKASDLVSRGYGEQLAEEIGTALLKNDLGPLGQAMGGITFVINTNVPRLKL